MKYFEENIIKNTFMDIVTKGEYPNFGSPECKCNKCMFHKVACNLSDKKDVVGCFHGWKREKD